MSPTLLRVLAAAALLLGLVLSASAADEAPGFQTIAVQLYLPDRVMQERAPDISNVATFIKAIQEVCTEHYATASKPEALDIVVAAKPGDKTRFWFVSSLKTPDKDFDVLRGKLAKVPAPNVVAGPIAFSLHSSIAGGSAPDKLPSKPPIPQEWQDAAKAAQAKEPLRVPDDFLKLVWPD